MTKRAAYPGGYNKNELMQIIDKIDAGKNQKMEGIIMNSNSGKSSPSGDRGTYEFHMDNCNHLISTSLRELSSKYKELGRQRTDSTDSVTTKLNKLLPEKKKA